MKIDDTNDIPFSYKEDISLNYSDDNRYIIAVKDEESPDKNIIPILYYDSGKVRPIDDYDMNKIYANPLHNESRGLPSLAERFSLNQLFKVQGSIKKSDSDYEGSSRPKCKTFQSYLNNFGKEEIIEVFNGTIDQSQSRIKLEETFLDTLIIDVYIEEGSPFFIEESNTLIGPFTAINKDSEGFFRVEKNSWKKFGEYELNDESYLEFYTNDIHRKIIIPSFNKLNLINEADFKDDSEILLDFKNKLKNVDNANNVNILYATLQKVAKNRSIQNDIKQNKRLQEIIKNTNDSILSEKELAEFIPEVESIKKEIESSKEKKLNISKDVEELLKRHKLIADKILLQKEEELKLNTQLENLSKTKKDELLKLKVDLEEEIERLENKKETLTTEIEEETEKESIELKKIKADKDYYSRQQTEMRMDLEALKTEINEIQHSSQTQLRDLVRHKKYFDFLSGRDISNSEEKSSEEYQDYSTLGIDYDKYTDFRAKVIKILNKNGRSHFDNHFIDNLLISIHQNTLTIFAGLPGVGKTSLARILTKILTLENKISEVSVNRGWTSQKDFIGFENPLTNKFHESQTGVYKILTQLNYEVENDLYMKSPMSFIILDEANLSPIEHYWSTFYNLTDTIASHNKCPEIELGNSRTLRYANNLRFIATINYDQTTESLSPRIIDRANIIQIPSNTISIDEITNEEIESLRLSYYNAKEFFNLLDFSDTKENFEFIDEIEIIYKKIIKHFTDLRINISPRVEIAIKRYCFTAKKWTLESSRPLDYCIAQRLLPMINIQGDNYKTKLNDLFKTFEEHDLNVSAKILRNIIDLGTEDNIFEGNYNYFLTLTYA